MSEKIKNIFIVFLISLAIYQTVTLWLISIPTNNEISGFPGLFTTNNKVEYENKDNYFIPSKIITNNSNKYYLQYSYLKDDEKLKLIKDALNISNDFTYSDLNYEIFEKDFIALSFDIKISDTLVEEALDVSLKEVSDFAFDNIYLTSFGDELNISLINVDTKEMYSSTINDLQLLNIYNKRILSSSNSLYYTLNINEGSIQFFPKWDIDILSYRDIELSNPYLTNSGLLKNNLTEKIKQLFDSTGGKVASTVDNNIVVISDAYNVAKYYYPSNVLEYSNYRNYSTTTKTTTYEDYITAYEFILKDENFNNEFYLSDYKVEDNKTTFYFDCVVNNFPILLNPSEKENLGINNFIEVSVSNGIVTYYKVLVYNYETANNSSLYSKNKLNNDLKNMNYDKLTMGYYLESDDNLILYWLLSNENNILIKSVK